MKPAKVDLEFIELVNRHQGIIHRICKIYGTTNEDRQDLFQEILYHLWKSYPTFKRESAFSTWMYRIALNTAITGLRKLKRRPELIEIDEKVNNAILASEESEGADNLELLYGAIRKLNQVERALVMLYLDDLSYKDMSEVLGLSENNVGVKLNRIKAKLHHLIQGLS